MPQPRTGEENRCPEEKRAEKRPRKKRGAYGARIKGKKEWMKKVRSLRDELNSLQPKITKESYRKLYLMIKGGYFRDKSHLKLYMTEKKLWKQEKKK
ncbi:MAG: 50S ribosomal protein L19e [archaeon]